MFVREDEKYIIERMAILKVDKDTCHRIYGVYDEELGTCKVKIREDVRKPNQIEIVRLIPEDKELRR
jgi:hypothetical protein